jgi:AcrR family transcriptional regulator
MVDAAIAVVAERGFDGASVDAIASEAGFSIGALYGNFEGKDGLFLAVYDAHAAWFEETLAAVDVSADADAVIAALFAALDDGREQFLVFLDFWAYAVRKPELADELAQRMAALRDAVTARLEERERETGRPLPLPAATLAVLLLAAWRGLALERLADRDAVAAEALTPLLATLLG